VKQHVQRLQQPHKIGPLELAGRAIRSVTIVVLPLILAACTTTPGTRTTPTFPAVPPSQVHIVAHSVTVTAIEGSNYHLTASASCGSGEQELGGGYVLSDVFESDYQLQASYPSSTTTWTVSTNSSSHYQLQVLVYCVQAYPALGVMILQASVCPAGSVQLSSGLQAGQTDVLCATHFVRAGATPGSFWLGTVEVHCSAASTGNSLSETRSFSYTCSWH
jgi:hypothetical protein